MCLKNKLLNKIKSPKIRKLIEDTSTRARFFFAFSIFGTFVFAVFNGVAGVMYRSVWYGSLAIYYIMLIIQKILLVLFGRYVSRKYSDDVCRLKKENTKIYLINGVFLLALDLALTAAIVQMATAEKPAKTGMVMAIATAAYAFFKIISATVNVFKTKKTDDVVLQVIRNIGFVAATVSMLALTSTLINTFGDVEDMRTMLAAVSVGVGLIITALGVYMIVKGALSLRKIQQENANNL